MGYISSKDIKIAEISKLLIFIILIMIWLADSNLVSLLLYMVMCFLSCIVYNIEINLNAVWVDKKVVKKHGFIQIHIRKGKENKIRLTTFIHILPQIILESVLVSLVYYTNLVHVIKSVYNNTVIEVDKTGFSLFLITITVCNIILIWRLVKNIIKYRGINI